jgi:hypothetical protein
MANSYSNLSMDELEEVYSVTKANYGSIAGALLEEINRRGGEAAFKVLVEAEKQLKVEKARIASEVSILMKGQSDPQFAKTMIKSNLLSEQELSDFIDIVARKHVVQQFNSKVDRSTVSGSIIGLTISVVIGVVITGLQISLLGQFFYASLIIVYVASWLTLRMITKKDAGNPLVLLSAVVATIIGPALTYWLLMR